MCTHLHTHTHSFSFIFGFTEGSEGKERKDKKKKKKTSSKFDLNKMVIQMGPLLISQRCVIIYNIWL